MEDVTFGPDQRGVDHGPRALAGHGRVGVAYSGGVDSATLLALAVRALGPRRVVAVLGVSPSLAATNGRGARGRRLHRRARSSRSAPTRVTTRHTSATVRTAASTARTSCSPASPTTVVAAHGLDAVAYGENADDARRPDRPGLPGRDRAPGAAPARGRRASTRPRCGASRGCSSCPAPTSRPPPASPRGSRTSRRSRPRSSRRSRRPRPGCGRSGFGDCRVRHHGEVARLELPPDDLARAAEPGLRDEVAARSCARPGSGSSRSTSPGIQSGAFTLPLVAVGRG